MWGPPSGGPGPAKARLKPAPTSDAGTREAGQCLMTHDGATRAPPRRVAHSVRGRRAAARRPDARLRRGVGAPRAVGAVLVSRADAAAERSRHLARLQRAAADS